jgi:hypothetical protein
MAAVEISIFGGRSLDIITLDFPPFTISLPSWIPHFYKSSENLYVRTALVTEGQPYIMKPLYRASGTSLPRAEISRSMSQLTAKGFVMDVVKVICEPCYFTGISERLPTSWKSTFLGLISMCTNAGHGQTASFTTDRKLIFDAFWRTLVLNRFKKTRVKTIAPENWAVPAKDWCDGDMVVPPYSGSSAQETDPLRPETFLNNIILSLRARRLVVTETSRLELASDAVQEGDLVVILFGCSVPVPIRKSLEPGQEGGYLLVGDAYVHGIMDGEAASRAEYPVETFTLV